MASAGRTQQFLHRLINRHFLFSQAGPSDLTAATAATAAAVGTSLPTVRSVSSRGRHSFSTTAAAACEAAPADATATTPPAAAAAVSAAAGPAQQPPAAGASTAAAGSGVLQSSCKVAGRTWTFETGRLAGLAHGSCVVTVEGTSVLGTAVVDPTPQLEADGVPLQVDYRERLSAVGRLPLRPDRRERVGTERELLVARLVDRALRPLLPPGFLYDTQVCVQLLSADGSIDPEVVAINAASAALLLARNIPFTHPVGAVKVRRVRRLQEWKGYRMAINTGVDALFDSSSSSSSTRSLHKPASSSANNTGSSSRLNLGLLYAGTPHKATAIEAAGSQTPEAVFVAALRLAAVSTRPLIEAQQQLAAAAAAAAGSQQQQQHLPLLWPDARVQQVVAELSEGPLRALFSHEQQQQQQQDNSGSSGSSNGRSSDKQSRAAALAGLQAELLRDLQRLGLLAETPPATAAAAGAAGAAGAAVGAGGMLCREDVLRAFDVLQSRVMREVLLNSQEPRRVDGRRVDELRTISCQAGPLPRVVHGSGLFSRGETQCMATATVGHDTDVAPEEGLWRRRGRSPLHLHYSFPPFSVGEVGKAGPPNRREVGHGNLARAGVAGVMPSEEEFPFCVRVTADTLSSSGSSSMAAVCAASLALRTAGVPTAALAAGISVGLVTQAPPQLGTPRPTQQGTGANTTAAASAGDTHQQQQQQQDGEGGIGWGASAVGYIDPSSYSSLVTAGADQQQQRADSAENSFSNAEAGSSSSSSSSDSESESDSSSSSSSDDESEAASNSSSSSGSGGAVRLLGSSYGRALLLSDIQGIEDHLGDMDFKVAGTARGITAVQLDTKLPGIDLHLLEAALGPAAEARTSLLAAMETALQTFTASHSSLELPQFGSTQIMKELVPRLIGPQGSTLTELEEGCGASLIVDDTGTINVYAPTQMRYQHALAAIQEVEGRGVVKGEVYRVRVLKIVDFGAYVTLPNGLPAMLHISELSHDKIREVRDVISEGQEFDVMCKGRDSKGFVQLSLKAMQPGPDAREGGQDGAAGGGPQLGKGSAEGEQPGSTLVADAAAAAGAGAPTGSLQDRLASAMAAIAGSSGGSSGSIGRASHQHHSSRPGVGSSSGSSRSRQAPRAMTWRPTPEQQQQQQQKPEKLEEQ